RATEDDGGGRRPDAVADRPARRTGRQRDVAGEHAERPDLLYPVLYWHEWRRPGPEGHPGAGAAGGDEEAAGANADAHERTQRGRREAAARVERGAGVHEGPAGELRLPGPAAAARRGRDGRGGTTPLSRGAVRDRRARLRALPPGQAPLAGVAG